MPPAIVMLVATFFSNYAEAQKVSSNQQGELLLSSYHGGFEAFLQEAIRTRKTAIIDVDAYPGSTITVAGDLRLVGRDHPTVHNNLPLLFLLKEGVHDFLNFNIVQAPGVTAFSTFVQNNIVWTNNLNGVNITGGRLAYESSRGGLYDPVKDKVVQWAGTTIENCVIKTSFVSIGIFSQDGPAKYLHMRNVDIYTDTSHNLYVHPNVSLRLYNLRSMKVGNSVSSGGAGLALHHFSGGGGELVNGVVRGVPSNARYVELKKCYTNRQPGLQGGMWQIAEPVTGFVLMDSCELAPYSIPLPRMKATNTRFMNIGGGAMVRGSLVNCTGTIGPTDGTTIDGCQLDEISLRGGGNIIVKNSVIKNVFGDKNPVNVVFENSSIEGMKITNPMPSKVILKKGSKLKNYLWGWKPEAGLMLTE